MNDSKKTAFAVLAKTTDLNNLWYVDQDGGVHNTSDSIQGIDVRVEIAETYFNVIWVVIEENGEGPIVDEFVGWVSHDELKIAIS